MIIEYTNGRFLSDAGWDDQIVVQTERDRITYVGDANRAPHPNKKVDLNGDFVAPGLFDIQVNGGGGVQFNEHPTVEALIEISAAHRRLGTTSILPTLISDQLSVVERGISAVRSAIERKVPGIAGIHIEGPCLDVEKRGIHDAKHIRQLDAQCVELFSSLGPGRTLVTISPNSGPFEAIDRLANSGIVVALGHSDASFETVEQAASAGATGMTHLFNAMSQMTSRAPGMVGFALSNREIWTSVIVDGVHVHPALLRLTHASRPPEKIILVSDSMANIGTDVSAFQLQGQAITVEHNKLINSSGTLAGASLTLLQAAKNAVNMMSVETADALKMASEYPATFMGLQKTIGRISKGNRADFVRFSAADLRFVSTAASGTWSQSDR